MSGRASGDVAAAGRPSSAGRGTEEFLGLDTAALCQDELFHLLEALETGARRQIAVGCALIAELDSRGVAGELAFASTGVLLSERLRIGRREAAARTRLAAAVAPRRALGGELLPPRFPQVAAVWPTGPSPPGMTQWSPRRSTRCRTGCSTTSQIWRLRSSPSWLSTLDPHRLAVLARSVVTCLDPDGQLAVDKEQVRRRQATLVVLPDGSGQLAATLTGEAAAVWQVVLDTLSRPVPADVDDQQDRRTPGQRRHDALLDAGRRLLRSGALPDAGGTPATVLVTLSVEQLEARTGLVTTCHGGLIGVPQALLMAADAQVLPAVLSTRGVALHLDRARRLATTGQRLALAARDGGCSFPACDRPPGWCETHHIIPWADGGATDVDNMTLLCGFHHREHANRGWAVRMRAGVPEWIPPRWIDPNAIQLSGACAELYGGGLRVFDVVIAGVFDALVLQSGSFNGTRAVAVSAGWVEPLDDLSDRCLDRFGESAGGKRPPGR